MRPPLPSPLPAAPLLGAGGSIAIIIIGGIALALWPSETAPPWMDTLNPITGMPYADVEEYDAVRHMTPEAVTRAIAKRLKEQAHAAPPASAAPARRHIGQTCEDDVLDALQAEKDRVCGRIPSQSCSPARVSPKRLARRPCSEIRKRIAALRACLEMRQRIQDVCFGGVPDKRHEKPFDDIESGLRHCLDLEAVNCAPGHPMADK